jgi:hypothetical protein
LSDPRLAPWAAFLRRFAAVFLAESATTHSIGEYFYRAQKKRALQHQGTKRMSTQEAL